MRRLQEPRWQDGPIRPRAGAAAAAVRRLCSSTAGMQQRYICCSTHSGARLPGDGGPDREQLDAGVAAWDRVVLAGGACRVWPEGRVRDMRAAGDTRHAALPRGDGCLACRGPQ